MKPLVFLIILVTVMFCVIFQSFSQMDSKKAESANTNTSGFLMKSQRYLKTKENFPPAESSLKTSAQYPDWDPQKQISLANLEMDPLKRRQMYDEIAKLWALTDSQACFEWAMSLTSPNDKSSVLISTVSAIVNSGKVDIAINLINKIPRGEFKDDSIVYSIRGIANIDMEQALDLVKSVSGEGALRSVAGDMAKVLAEQGRFGEMHEIWERISYGSFRDQFGFFLVHNICQENPLKAMNWVFENSEFFDSHNAMRRIASEYAKRDPKEALESAGQINDSALKNAYLQQLGKAWGRDNPIAAGEWLLKATADSGYKANKLLGDGIIAEWVQWDHDKAITALETIQDPLERKQAKLTAVQALATFDPAKAANMILPLLTAESVQSQSAIKSLTSNWMLRDPLAASQWIGTLVEGRLKDVSIEQIVLNILSKDKDIIMANSWAAQISDPTIKAQVNANIDKTRP
jgi:hypothetical protein